MFGILLVIWPAAGALTLVVLIGISAIVFGVALLALSIQLFRERREARTATGGHRHATA